MEQRHGLYSRPGDRPLIQNPNHAVSQPTPHHYHQPPTSQQPPFQIPPSDPFQRRAPDPFLPQPHTQRRGSYGMGSGRDAVSVSHAERPPLGAPWAGTAGSNPPPLHHHPGPPPPALSQPLGAPPAPAYAAEHARRRSLGGQSPTRHYASVSMTEPPPPPSFMSRQMPPPSPSQQPMSGPYSGQRGPPAPPIFSSTRELPGLGSAPRPGAGMSISSILGESPALQAPSHPQHTSPTGQSLSPTAGPPPSMSPHKRGHSITSKLEYGWRRPHTPDRHHLPPGVRGGDATSFSANSSPAHFLSRRSPDNSRAGPPLFQQSYQPPGPPRTYQGSPREPHEQTDHPHIDDRIPPRPSSQPSGVASQRHEDMTPREHMPPFSLKPQPSNYVPDGRRDEQRFTPAPLYEPLRDRPANGEPGGQVFSPPTDSRDAPIKQRDGAHRDNAIKEDFNGTFRTGFRSQYYQPRGPGPAPEAPRSHPQMINPFDRPRDERPLYPGQDRLTSASVDPLSRDDRRVSEPLAPGEGPYRGLLQDQPLAMQRSRSSIGLEGKRGRASPLPQAVQGAQMEPSRVGSDPNIKSEFGRIFQGLGSGLGHGSLTPSRGSPMPQRHPSNVDGDAIVLSDGELPRSGSISKRHKRVKEEDGRFDNDQLDGRGTPFGSNARGSKRPKAGHHHHLHQHNHAHHHHVHGHGHRQEEGLQASNQATSHHHHHIHTSHHHHHTSVAPRAQAQTPVAPLPKPTINISSQPVMDSVRDRSRKHLGSELYDPNITLPPAAMASHTDDKFGYFLRYKPSRSFDEKDLNCTFTIRIPRAYLNKEVRENIVRNRFLFGSDVYTDDSDPLAVLIHSGWLRGEWPEEVDADMMDLPPAPVDKVDNSSEEHTTRPPAPVVPPPDKDLHLTMLILPPLKKYLGCVRYGIRSRDWEDGSRHDGVSWSVLSMRWVDEGPSSWGLGRSGKARRERMESQRRESAALALLGLAGVADGGALSGGRIGIAAA